MKVMAGVRREKGERQESNRGKKKNLGEKKVIQWRRDLVRIIGGQRERSEEKQWRRYRTG